MTDRPVRTLVIAFGGAAAVLALGAGTALLARPHAPAPALGAVAGGPAAPAAAALPSSLAAATVPPPRDLPRQVASSPAAHTATSVVSSRAAVAHRATRTPAPSLPANRAAEPTAAPSAPPAPPAAPVLRGPEGKPTASLYVTAAEVAAAKRAQAAQQQAPQPASGCVPQAGQPCWDAAQGLWECPNEVTGAVAPCTPAELRVLQSDLPWYTKAQDCVMGVGCRFGTKYTG